LQGWTDARHGAVSADDTRSAGAIYAGEVPPPAPDRIVIRNQKRVATGNHLDAMRVQMTPARAPEELATEVVGGRFDGGGIATAAGHLGNPAIHRPRTPRMLAKVRAPDASSRDGAP